MSQVVGPGGQGECSISLEVLSKSNTFEGVDFLAREKPRTPSQLDARSFVTSQRVLELPVHEFGHSGRPISALLP